MRKEIKLAERFYFDIENGTEIICDGEGVEAESLEEALEEARGVIREMANEVIDGRRDEQWVLVVRDAGGSLVGRIPIKK